MSYILSFARMGATSVGVSLSVYGVRVVRPASKARELAQMAMFSAGMGPAYTRQLELAMGCKAVAL